MTGGAFELVDAVGLHNRSETIANRLNRRICVLKESHRQSSRRDPNSLFISLPFYNGKLASSSVVEIVLKVDDKVLF